MMMIIDMDNIHVLHQKLVPLASEENPAAVMPVIGRACPDSCRQRKNNYINQVIGLPCESQCTKKRRYHVSAGFKFFQTINHLKTSVFNTLSRHMTAINAH